MAIKIVGKGIGRPDYTSDVFIQPIPQIRGPIHSTVYRKEIMDLAPGQSVTISETFSPAHYVYLAELSASANVYVELAFIIGGEDYPFRGWGNVTVPLPASYPFSNFNVRITNLSDITISRLIYCHYAVLGVEQIIPYIFVPKM